MKFRRWFSPVASAAAITLLGGLTAFAVEGTVDDEPVAATAEQEEPEEAEEPEDDDLVFDIDVDTGGDDTEDPDANDHGQTVSEFANNTELEGCQKGMAVSLVARGADPEEAESEAADNAPCNGKGEGDNTDDLDTDDLDAEDDDGGPPPHAGPPANAGPPSHAGPPNR